MNQKNHILHQNLFLYFTEFFAGMAVMAVELGASRLLAPYFSSSQIVWTIIIGTIMIAMALGNIYGGKTADRDANPDRLFKRIIVAAVWIGLIPAVGKYVILAITGLLVLTVSNHFLVIAAFAACMIIFVFPLFLLGTVTPSLVKYTMNNLDDNGRIVGTLGAFNTIGSIIGTFLPTFVTIPAVGTSVTFLIFSGILLILSGIYFFSAGRKSPGQHKPCAHLITGAVLFLLCCKLGHSDSFAFWEKNLTYEGESIYNYLQVKETDEDVILSTNVMFGVQSILKKDPGLTGMYYDYAMAAPYMADIYGKDGADILILGMGTGTYATQCRRYFDNVNIEGVEIDGKIVDLSREYFSLPDTVPVTTYDGRAYLQAIDRQYDVIMVDAYQDITIPFQMSTLEFFSMVKAHLKPDGVMVVNMNMRGQSEGNINQYLADTISHVFDRVMTVDVAHSTNRELFAGNSDILDKLDGNMRAETNPELSAMMETVRGNITDYKAGAYLMTDDRAPVELLGMQVIDEIIRDELRYYKKVYETDGLQGVLDNI